MRRTLSLLDEKNQVKLTSLNRRNIALYKEIGINELNAVLEFLSEAPKQLFLCRSSKNVVKTKGTIRRHTRHSHCQW